MEAPKKCSVQLERVVVMGGFLEEVTPELSFREWGRDGVEEEEGISDGIESMYR